MTVRVSGWVAAVVVVVVVVVVGVLLTNDDQVIGSDPSGLVSFCCETDGRTEHRS